MKIIKDVDTVLIIENKDDIINSKPVCGQELNYIFVPLELKEQFLLSEFRISLLPCLIFKGQTTGKIHYYE